MLRLRHLDRRSDELTGSSVGHGFFRCGCGKCWGIFLGSTLWSLPWVLKDVQGLFMLTGVHANNDKFAKPFF